LSACCHTAAEWCQPEELATLSFSAFLVVCDQEKKANVGQQISKGGNLCDKNRLLEELEAKQLTLLLMYPWTILGITVQMSYVEGCWQQN